MNLPNRLTVLRVVLVPVFVTALAYWTPDRDACRLVALLVFLAACVTDALDGWIARRTRQKTRLGALIDPLADKILLTSAYLALAWMPGIPDAARLPFWLTIIVISRDLLLVTGATIIFMMQSRFEAQTNLLGKATTLVQMLLVIAVLAGAPTGMIDALVIATGAVTFLSGGVYLKSGISRLNGAGGNERA